MKQLLSSISSRPVNKMTIKNVVFVPAREQKTRPAVSGSLAQLLPTMSSAIHKITFVDVAPTPEFFEKLNPHYCAQLRTVAFSHVGAELAAPAVTPNQHREAEALERFFVNCSRDAPLEIQVDAMSFPQLQAVSNSFATGLAFKCNGADEVVAAISFTFTDGSQRNVQVRFSFGTVFTTLSSELRALATLRFETGFAVSPAMLDLIDTVYSQLKAPSLKRILWDCSDVDTATSEEVAAAKKKCLEAAENGCRRRSSDSPVYHFVPKFE
jgi:hypothetical protein